MSSRLFREVREERGLAYAIYGFRLSYAEMGVWGVYVGTTPSLADTALNVIRDELAKVAEGFQAEGENLGVDAMADAGVLVTMVAHVAAHHHGFELWGIGAPEVRVALARHVYWGITGQAPPVE